MAQCSNPEEFYSTRSFVDKKQKEFSLLSTLECLVLQSEQYHPVAQNTSSQRSEMWDKNHYKCQATKYRPVLSYYSKGIYQVVTFPGCRTCTQEPGNKARVPGSQQDAHAWVPGMNISDWRRWAWETEMLEFICLNHCYQAFSRGWSDMRGQRHWHCDLDCQLKLIANLLYSFDSAVILNIRSFYPARFTWNGKVFFDHAEAALIEIELSTVM